MADYFVKVGGNDGNDGTTWALAKATVQAGLNLCGTAGDRCVVGAGTYYESGLTPPSAGARGTNKILIGDYNGTIADGGSNYSGVTGYVKIDGSVQSANKGAGATGVVVASDNWAYWSIRQLWITGSADVVNYAPTTAPTTNDGTDISDCIIESMGGIALSLYYWQVDPDTYSPITVNRCAIITRRIYATFYYEAAANLLAYKQTAFTTNPQYVFNRCFLLGGRCSVLTVGVVNYYTFTKYNNCDLGMFYVDSASTSGVIYNSATYSKSVAENSVLVGSDQYYPAGNNNITLTNCKEYYSTATTRSNLTSVPLLPFMSYLWSGSVLVNADTTGTGQPYNDLFGVTGVQGADDDYGSQELYTNRYPKEPTMIPGTHDIPDIGNVTEDDTSDGSTGTYHEATTAEVQSGVAFGAGSALTGTLLVEGGTVGISRGRLVNSGGQ